VLVNQDLAIIRLVQAVEDAHQGGFPGAVLTQQRVDFACSHIKIDVIVGNYARETLDDTAKFYFRNPPGRR
jgi:hypothetical protein